MAALREVVEKQGLFCALYSDRASHFFLTPKAGERVDHHRLTQVGRAMRELGIQMIPAYSPQARGRCERSFGTWQDVCRRSCVWRVSTLGGSQPVFAGALHCRVQPPVACRRRLGDCISALRTEGSGLGLYDPDRAGGGQDNTFACNAGWQIDKCRWRHCLAGARWRCMITWTQRLRFATVPMWWAALKEAEPLARTRAQWKRRSDGSRGKPKAGFHRLPQLLGNLANGARFPLSHCASAALIPKPKKSKPGNRAA